MGRLLKSISIRRPANHHTKICLKKKNKKLKICYLFWKTIIFGNFRKLFSTIRGSNFLFIDFT
jgi:hypothetical protein